MTQLVQVAVAGGVAEGEEMQGILLTAGIESELQPAIDHDLAVPDDPPLRVLVADGDVQAARDAIEALTEPDDLIEPDDQQ
jgi:hypothetical protein